MADLSDIKHKLGLGDDGLAGLGHNIITAPVEELVKWARRRSLMPATFGSGMLRNRNDGHGNSSL